MRKNLNFCSVFCFREVLMEFCGRFEFLADGCLFSA